VRRSFDPHLGHIATFRPRQLFARVTRQRDPHPV
jgi:hypothetical protein